jgi:hypothetical protein
MIDFKYNGTENVLVSFAFQVPPYLYWGNDFDFFITRLHKQIFPCFDLNPNIVWLQLSKFHIFWFSFVKFEQSTITLIVNLSL